MGNTNSRNKPRPGEKKMTTIDDLPDGVLVSIFKRLPLKKRVEIEAVSKRWRNLAKWKSWTNFHTLSLHLYPPPESKDGDYGSSWLCMWLYAMLERCGPYVQEISFANLPISWESSSLLRRAPNVKHLYLDSIDRDEPELTDEILAEIGDALPRLKSIRFSGLEISDSRLTNFRAFVEKCQQLECLCIDSCNSNDEDEVFIEGLTGISFPALKFLKIDLSFDMLTLLRNIVRSNGNGIESFVLEEDKDGKLFWGYKGMDTLSDNVTRAILGMSGLRHLAIRSPHVRRHHLVELLREIGERLESLELKFTSREVLNCVTAHCPNLLHLAIETDGDGFEVPLGANYVDLGRLTSLEFDGDVPEGLLRAIASHGQLQFVKLNSSGDAMAKEIRFAIKSCKSLSHLNVDDLWIRYTMIRLGMDEREKKSISNGDSEDEESEGILHLHRRISERYKYFPRHPRIRIIDTTERPYITEKEASDKIGIVNVIEDSWRNTVRDRIIYGTLTGGGPGFLKCACRSCCD